MTEPQPALEYTEDHNLFVDNRLNRDFREKPALHASLKLHGFIPSFPIRCRSIGGGKLEITGGHHRLHYSKELGIGVYYIVDNKHFDLFEAEGPSGQTQIWTLEDFLVARAKGGDEHCGMVLAFRARHGLPLRIAISLIGGESAGSANREDQVRRGTFRIAADLSHAHLVAELVDFCSAAGAECASAAGFITALSSSCRIPEFDPGTFKRRVQRMPSLLKKQATRKDYLALIESVYNYGAKEKRTPLAMRAHEIGLARQKTFGRSDT